MEIEGNLAYIINYGADYDLEIFNITNPSQPVKLSSLAVGGGYTLAKYDDYIYVGDNGDYVKIIDVSNPKTPFQVGTVKTHAGTTLASSISGDYYFVACCYGLKIYKIADLVSLKELKAVDTIGVGYDVVVENNLAYFADGGAGFKIFNVSDPSNPVLIGTSMTSYHSTCIYVKGNLAFTDGRILNITDPTNPYVLGSNAGYRTVVEGNIAYTTMIYTLFLLT